MGAMALIKMNFQSKALGKQTNVTVFLPSYSFEDSRAGKEVRCVPGVKFQTLYLLHGGLGDDSDYVTYTNIVRYADEAKLAVVMPCGYNSSYTDAEDGAGYFTYIAEELPEICGAYSPLSNKREDTFVGGLSMGSHGAMKLAIVHPERFAAALMMSGASYRPGVPSVVKTVNGQFDFAAKMPTPIGASLQAKLEDESFIRGTVNDVYAIAKRNVAEGKPLPKLFFRVGDCDHALYRTLQAEKDLREWGYETKLEGVPGMGHEWDLWDDTLRLAIREWLPLRRQPIYPGDDQ
jgi:S-formylglutathione hydrolase FrmB